MRWRSALAVLASAAFLTFGPVPGAGVAAAAPPCPAGAGCLWPMSDFQGTAITVWPNGAFNQCFAIPDRQDALSFWNRSGATMFVYAQSDCRPDLGYYGVPNEDGTGRLTKISFGYCFDNGVWPGCPKQD